MQLPFILKKDQGKEEGLNVRTQRHPESITTEVKSGHKRCSSVFSQEFTPSQGLQWIKVTRKASCYRLACATLPSLWENGQRCGVKGTPNVSKGGRDHNSLGFCVLGHQKYMKTREHPDL